MITWTRNRCKLGARAICAAPYVPPECGGRRTLQDLVVTVAAWDVARHAHASAAYGAWCNYHKIMIIRRRRRKLGCTSTKYSGFFSIHNSRQSRESDRNHTSEFKRNTYYCVHVYSNGKKAWCSATSLLHWTKYSSCQTHLQGQVPI